jgi:hypothetical protein
MSLFFPNDDGKKYSVIDDLRIDEQNEEQNGKNAFYIQSCVLTAHDEADIGKVHDCC